MAQAEIHGEIIHCSRCGQSTRREYGDAPVVIEISREELLEHMMLDDQYGQPEAEAGSGRMYFHRSALCEDCLSVRWN